MWLFFGCSEVYQLNKSEAATAPRGTPERTRDIFDMSDSDVTTKFLYSRYDLNTG